MNNKKSGFVTIIGRPNVGKSTLMNHLIGQKIAIMSDKPQTTRNRIQTILTNDLGQIVFIDTPGIHVPMTKLGEFMNTSAETTLNEVDVVLWLIEPDKKIGKGDRYIIERLARVETPVFLVINKMDTIAKNELLEVIATYKDQYNFKDIIPISALKGDNTDILLDQIFDVLEDGPMYFPEDMITDQPERQICAELIREKVLLNMEQEIPHGIAVVIDQMKEREDQAIVDIDATIVCEKDSHKGMVIGKQGSMLKKIGSMARRDMENLLGSKVNLKIWVRVKKDWRDSDYLLKNYGYTNKE
ncbi:maturation of 16S RNA and assembly of 30S ribosomal subunit GTPase [Petrocella atlantisensis]|uniref:GTPase Era n=1 Tax=Petrocella atlantisensis TaxID=2173034 RepID=A0A3P7Q0P0_9FIRM|nr:GTPase Era [Petrocella atlantisensis]VDN48961.1 maturation of 16S RNA and assembly of 30S ribosomal subunit GTPase [Petrocella atlantisensis]